MPGAVAVQIVVGVHARMPAAIGAVVVTLVQTRSLELGVLVGASTLPRVTEFHRMCGGDRSFAGAALRPAAIPSRPRAR